MKNFLNNLENILTKDNLGLYKMMQYHFGIDDNHEQSIKYEFPYGSISEIFSNHLKLNENISVQVSTAIELLNASFEVHEDVRNGNTERLNKESLWWKYGPAQAINVGDGFQALSRSVLLNISDYFDDHKILLDLISNFDNRIIEICETENFELSLQELPITKTDDYFSIIRNKYGSLLSNSMVLPSKLIKNETNNLRNLANNLMIYEKIRKDVEFLNQDSPKDSAQFGGILSKNKPLPVIYVFENGNPTQKRKIGEIYLDRVIDPKKITNIKELCLELDTITLSINTAEKFKEKGYKTLKDLDFSEDQITAIFEKIKHI
ncbi:MAG: polyprenyl synthetase family protein [Dehalococcoidia bacterium]|nr:polyprenyl synthetase family protein [Dehalococcoidia bacterium]|tara:strand:+ start:626 stop:1585 length:960 start_codon:yes stop_codon:yes gene_type:complete